MKGHTREELDKILHFRIAPSANRYHVYNEKGEAIRQVRRVVMDIELGEQPTATISVMCIEKSTIVKDGEEIAVSGASILDNLDGVGEIEKGCEYEKMPNGKYIKVMKITRPYTLLIQLL